jgi:hypothetical protein
MRTKGLQVIMLTLLILFSGASNYAGVSSPISSPVTPAATTAGSATGTAIGVGVKSFLDAAFPAGSTLLTLIQGWLSKKLTPTQQTEVKNGADAKKTDAAKDPLIKPDVQNILDAAQTLELTSVVLSDTNNAAVKASSMIAILDTTKPTADLPLPKLKSLWEDLKGDLSALNEDSTLTKARAATTDIAVIGAFQDLERASKGPVGTVNDNLAPKGDRGELRDALQKIVDATSQFNNLAVVLLGSTGTEITKSVNDFSKAGGASKLDDMTDKAVSAARSSIPDPIQ